MLYPCTHTQPPHLRTKELSHILLLFLLLLHDIKTCFWRQLLAHLTFRSWNIPSTVLLSKVCLDVVHYCSIKKPLLCGHSVVKESFREAQWHHSQDAAARIEKLHPPWVLAKYHKNILSWKGSITIIQFSSWPYRDTPTILPCASLRMLSKGSLIQKINQE